MGILFIFARRCAVKATKSNKHFLFGSNHVIVGQNSKSSTLLGMQIVVTKRVSRSLFLLKSRCSSLVVFLGPILLSYPISKISP